jgi:hypothetical protein
MSLSLERAKPNPFRSLSSSEVDGKFPGADETGHFVSQPAHTRHAFTAREA